MGLKCKGEGCSNVYGLDVVGSGRGWVGLVVVSWKCNVCGKWNFYVQVSLDDMGEVVKAGW